MKKLIAVMFCMAILPLASAYEKNDGEGYFNDGFSSSDGIARLVSMNISGGKLFLPGIREDFDFSSSLHKACYADVLGVPAALYPADCVPCSDYSDLQEADGEYWYNTSIGGKKLVQIFAFRLGDDSDILNISIFWKGNSTYSGGGLYARNGTLWQFLAEIPQGASEVNMSVSNGGTYINSTGFAHFMAMGGSGGDPPEESILKTDYIYASVIRNGRQWKGSAESKIIEPSDVIMWDRFRAERSVDDDSSLSFSIFNSSGKILCSGLSGNGDDISECAGDSGKIFLVVNATSKFNLSSPAVFSWKVTWRKSGEDIERPEVSLDSPVDMSFISESPATLECSAEDNEAVRRITLYDDISGEFLPRETKEFSDSDSAEALFERDVEKNYLTYRWNCYACDAYSNCNFAEDNYTFTADLTFTEGMETGITILSKRVIIFIKSMASGKQFSFNITEAILKKDADERPDWFPLTYINITSDEARADVKLTFSPPEDPEDNQYMPFEMKKENLPDGFIDELMIGFRIEKGWQESEGVDSESVFMALKSGSWKALATEYDSESSYYSFFHADYSEREPMPAVFAPDYVSFAIYSQKICDPMESKCDGNNSLVCNDEGSGWDTEICENGCENGKCVPDSICIPDEKRCYGKKIQVCSSGGAKWEDEETCSYKCKDGACVLEAGECQTGGKKCDGDAPMRCSSGKWVAAAACGDGEKCEEGVCVDEGSGGLPMTLLIGISLIVALGVGIFILWYFRYRQDEWRQLKKKYAAYDTASRQRRLQQARRTVPYRRGARPPARSAPHSSRRPPARRR